jgi:hypothetical protein
MAEKADLTANHVNLVNSVETSFLPAGTIPGATLLAAAASVKMAERRVRRAWIDRLPF